MYITYTVKTENCAVVILCVLMDDTPTIDIMWIFCGFFLFLCTKNAGVCFLLCGKPLPARIARIKPRIIFCFYGIHVPVRM